MSISYIALSPIFEPPYSVIGPKPALTPTYYLESCQHPVSVSPYLSIQPLQRVVGSDMMLMRSRENLERFRNEIA